MAKDKSKESGAEQLRPEIVEITPESSVKEMNTFRTHLENAVKGTEKAKALLFGVASCGHMIEVEVSPKAVAKTLLEYDYPFHLATKSSAPKEMWQKLSDLAGFVITANVVMKFEPNKNPNTKTD